MKFDSIYEMVDEINDTVERTVRETMLPCKAEDLGLDRRAGYTLFVNCDCIAVEGDGHMLDYYGGFEYVDRDYVHVVGNWKFYMADDDRVQECIARYYDKAQAEEEVDI